MYFNVCVSALDLTIFYKFTEINNLVLVWCRIQNLTTSNTLKIKYVFIFQFNDEYYCKNVKLCKDDLL